MAQLKLFRNTQSYFDGLGFYKPSQSNQSCKLNRINGFYMFVATVSIIPVLGFLIFQAKSAYDFSISFYILNTTLGNVVYYAVFFQKMGAIRHLIEKYEIFIAKRKC